MSWTGPADIRDQLQKLWDRGVLLAILAGEKNIFPRRLVLKKPKSAELSTKFEQVRTWVVELDRKPHCYRLEWRTVNHRIVGSNRIPAEVWVDTLDDALKILGKERAAKRFTDLVALTGKRHLRLVDWLAKRPLKALEMADHWPQLLDIVDWVLAHPHSEVYLRQIDIPGVHTKFIEQNRGLLAELLDLVVPTEQIDASASGVRGFCKRYGFRDKPERIRFRILDSALALPFGGRDQDITLTADAFAELDISVRTVFITENEVNFLAFPQFPQAMVIFGAGYGFDSMAAADWLKEKNIFYWGDIDTHGFAILDQLRMYFPHAVSFLMDRDTLLTQRSLWGREAKQEKRNLTRLTAREQALYDDLCNDRLGEQVRLEQEYIGYATVNAHLNSVYSETAILP